MKEFYRNKKVLITGHTGFKGAWLSKILISFGADVLGYSLESHTTPSLFNFLNIKNQMKSVIGDIRDYEKLNKIICEFQPDIVFHLAAIAQVGEANADPIKAYQTNTQGLINLLEATRNCKSIISFVNVSTDAVYPNFLNTYKEEDIIKGNNTYGNSKSCAEYVIYNYKNLYFNDYPRISSTRCVNIIGGGDFNRGRILPDCVNSLLEGKDIEIKSPNNIRPFLHVLEALHGYLLLAMKQYNDKSFEGDYNFSPLDSDYVAIKDIASIFCEKTNNVIKWIDVSHSNILHKKIITDSNKARDLLGWKSVYNIEERIELIVNWTNAYLNNEDITNKQIDDFFLKVKDNI